MSTPGWATATVEGVEVDTRHWIRGTPSLVAGPS